MGGRSLGVAVLLICLPAFGQKREPVDTSICSIATHPSKFHNKYVRVRGTASSGMEASILIEFKDGKWKQERGRINLEFDSAGSDESTTRFLQLFGEQYPRQSATATNDLYRNISMLWIRAPRPRRLALISSVCLSLALGTASLRPLPGSFDTPAENSDIPALATCECSIFS